MSQVQGSSMQGLCEGGQAAIEGVVSIIGALVLFIGAVQIWEWFSQSYVERQIAYQQTRSEAGSGRPGRDIPYDQPLLNIFDEPGLRGKTVGSVADAAKDRLDADQSNRPSGPSPEEQAGQQQKDTILHDGQQLVKNGRDQVEQGRQRLRDAGDGDKIPVVNERQAAQNALEQIRQQNPTAADRLTDPVNHGFDGVLPPSGASQTQVRHDE